MVEELLPLRKKNIHENVTTMSSHDKEWGDTTTTNPKTTPQNGFVKKQNATIGLLDAASLAVTLSLTLQASSSSSSSPPPCDIGNAVWVAYSCILSLVQSLLRQSSSFPKDIPSTGDDDYVKEEEELSEDDEMSEEDDDDDDTSFSASSSETATTTDDDEEEESYHKEENPIIARQEQIKLLINGSFAPSLAVLQHFLKRFPGSSIITKRTLMGYVCLANASIPMMMTIRRNYEEEDGMKELRRKAILSSLCKLSLPCWGRKNESTRYLSNHHIEAILSLIQIIHSNYDCITSDWYIILCTFEQLGSLSMSSPKLSEDCYELVPTLSKCFSRLSLFTTCLSTESLSAFIDALVSLSSGSTERTNSKNDEASSSTTLSAGKKGGQFNSSAYDIEYNVYSDEGNTKESSLGGKLMSFAGRAFSGGLVGGGGGAAGPTSAYSQDQEYFLDSADLRGRPSKAYSDEFCQAVYDRLAATKPTTRKDVFRRLPFSLVALTDVTLANLFRFSICAKAVSGHLCDIATTASSSDIRLYAMDTLSSLITSSLSGGNMMSFTESGPSTIIANPTSADEFLGVVRAKQGDINNAAASQTVYTDSAADNQQQVSQVELLTPLCKTIASTDQQDTAEAGLNALHVILEGAGHNLSGDAWPILIEAISDLSGDCSNAQGRFSADRSAETWNTCSTLAFRCLKLIVDDFLDQLPTSTDPSYATTRAALLDCCASFGRSQHDVNTSLTATGMLWTIADQDPTPSSLDDVLSKLAFLALDSRAEVRNCSVNTLFSCVVGLGHRFTSEQWRICLSQTIFGVLEQVASHVDESTTASKQALSSVREARKKANSRYKVTVHHSRDSVGKQWFSTQVLTLRGLERVLRQFFSALLSTTVLDSRHSSSDESHWFESAWARILDIAFQCATQAGGREVLELRLAGVDLVVLCALLSCRAGIVAATTPARVGTNMEVVNGALRSIQNESKTNQSRSDGIEDGTSDGSAANSPEMEACRQELFLDAFDVLERFRSHLEDDKAQAKDEYSQSLCIESVSLQVVTKLSQGLVKLYECCKNDEMAPRTHELLYSSDDEDDTEARFVAIVSTVIRKAVGDSGPRYLSQAQRVGIDLLHDMAFGSSSRAFETLADIGGESFFWQQSSSQADDTNHEGSAEYEGSDFLGYEVAKVVADAIVSDGVPTGSKAEVLCTILSVFCSKQLSSSAQLDSSQHSVEHQHDPEDSSESNSTEKIIGKICFDLFVPVVKGGLCAAHLLEKKHYDSVLAAKKSHFDDDRMKTEWMNLLLDDIWKRMIQFLSYLMTPLKSPAKERYATDTRTILQIVSCCVSRIPSRKRPYLGSILSQGARQALVVSKVQTVCSSDDSPSSREVLLQWSNSFREDVEDGLRIFNACFISLCKVQPESSMLLSIAKSVLKESIDFSEEKLRRLSSGDTDAFDLSDYDFNLDGSKESEESEENYTTSISVAVESALIVCDALHSFPNMIDQVIEIFPLLCQLTNTNNDRLRRKAGALLGNVDLAANIGMANRRAEAFEQRALKAEKINADLMEQNAVLKYENEELHQKLAIYSESSVIT
mmetsp:Transcript_15630/g.20886  ORF Transcript_15630/g.20886 Transcript_15630/m.20886 type:complete len:1566 (+) Transcript_15630:106-4803(+)